MKQHNSTTVVWPRRLAPLGATAALLLGCGLAAAQDNTPAPPAPAKTNKWEGSATAAVTLTSGNSESFLATVTAQIRRKWEHDTLSFGAAGGYGESTVNDVNTKNTEFIQGYAQFDHLFTERFYAGLRFDGQYDGIAGVDYRFKITPLAGYYLIKNKKMSLSVEAGPSGVFEHLQGRDPDQYIAIRFCEAFEYQLTDTTKIFQSVSYTPQVDAWIDNYLVNFEAGIDTAITKQLSLRVVFQDLYASDPAPGKKDNDIRLLAGIGFKF
jgi:putative salt-induced outer membrane protein YdiY